MVEDVGAFAARYGEALPVAGVPGAAGWATAANRSRSLRARRRCTSSATRTHGTAQSDGGGRSLEIVVEASDELAMWGEASGWLASIGWGGTPGLARGAGRRVATGDMNLDGVVDRSDA